MPRDPCLHLQASKKEKRVYVMKSMIEKCVMPVMCQDAVGGSDDRGENGPRPLVGTLSSGLWQTAREQHKLIRVF